MRWFLFYKILSKSWIKSFFITLFILVALILIADLVSGFLKDNLPVKDVFLNFFFSFPFYLGKILPLASLFATLFSLNSLRQHSELISILGSGFSYRRIILFFSLFGLIIGCSHFLLSGFISPYFQSLKKDSLQNAKRFKFIKTKSLKKSTLDSGKIWLRGSNYFFSFFTYDKYKKIFNNASLYYLDSNSQQTTLLQAKKISHLKDHQWTASSVLKKTSLSDGSFVESQFFKTYPLNLEHAPQDYNYIESDLNTISFFGFWNFIQKLKASDINTVEYESLLLEKILSPLSCFLFIFLGLLVLFEPQKRNSKFSLTLSYSFLFLLIYWTLNSSLIPLLSSSGYNLYTIAALIPTLFLVILFSFLFVKKDL